MTAHTLCAVQVNRLSGFRKVCAPVPMITFFRNKKQPLANRKIQEPSGLQRKIFAGTCDRRTGEGDKRRESFTGFCITKCMNKGPPWSGCPVSNPDPKNTIGLFSSLSAPTNIEEQTAGSDLCRS